MTLIQGIRITAHVGVVKVAVQVRSEKSRWQIQEIRRFAILICNPQPYVLEVGGGFLGEMHHQASTLTVGIDPGFDRRALFRREARSGSAAYSHMAVYVVERIV